MNWITLEQSGIIFTDRIVAIAPAESAASKRLLASIPLNKIVSMTNGRKRETIVVLDSGHVILTAVQLPTLERLLLNEKLEI